MTPDTQRSLNASQDRTFVHLGRATGFRYQISSPERHGVHREDDAPPTVVACRLNGRPTGKTIFWNVPCQKGGAGATLSHAPPSPANADRQFTISELQRFGTDLEALLADPHVRKFMD